MPRAMVCGLRDGNVVKCGKLVRVLNGPGKETEMETIAAPEQVVETLGAVAAEAQKRAKRETQAYGTMSPGDWHAQGDVMFLRIEAVPENAVPCETRAQLAPGKTRGRRHVIADADLPKVKFYPVRGADELTGPVLDVSEKVEVTHPDHGHVVLPKGVHQVRYQRLYAPKIKRVTD